MGRLTPEHYQPPVLDLPEAEVIDVNGRLRRIIIAINDGKLQNIAPNMQRGSKFIIKPVVRNKWILKWVNI